MGLACLCLLLALAGCEDVRLPDPDVRYVAFGDSSTAGPTEVDYPELLAGLLDIPPNQIANEGNGGETTGEGLERLNQLIAGSIFPNAQILIYWEGGGDVISFLRGVDPFLTLSPDSPEYPFRSGLNQTLESAQANMEAAVAAAADVGWQTYVATYPLRPPVALPCDALPIPLMLPGQTQIANRYTELINDRIRQAAANSGAALVDLAADERLDGDLGTFIDCNHLSPSANQLAAGVFAAALAGG